MEKSIYSESLAEDRDNFIDNLFNKTVDVALDDVDDVQNVYHNVELGE